MDERTNKNLICCKKWDFLHCCDSINREPFDRSVVWFWLILAQLHKLGINLLIPAAQSSTNLWKFNQRPSLTHLSLTLVIILKNLFTLSIMLGTKTRRRYGDVQTLLKVLAQMWAGRLLPDDQHSSSELYCFFCYCYCYYHYYYYHYHYYYYHYHY